MKTTLNLPDDLMIAVKIRAAQKNKKLQDTVSELLRIGLAYQPTRTLRGNAFPLIECLREASPGDEMVSERIAELLEQEDAIGSL